VRDLIRGVTPSDYDITTSARPEEIKALFSDIKTVDTGIKHGTVTLVIDGAPYEVTTYRIDGEYLDARHPSGVQFTDKLSLDLERRDFTMNAIAYNPRVGLVDTTGGIADIERRLIRCVGNARVRFSEDALRILRAVRFSATLGFDIDSSTADAISALRDTVLLVSRERIYAELKKLLSGDYAMRVISEYMPLFTLIIPEWNGIKAPSSYIDADNDFTVRLISLFALAGATGDEFAERMRELRADGATVKAGATVLSSLHKYDLSKKDGLISLALSIGKEYARLLVRVAISVGVADASSISLLDTVTGNTPLTLRALKITGEDLASLGYRGERIGEMLKSLLDAVAHGRLENERDALLKVAKSAEK
jgi:tRNA nucleotidyltransferase (CCA-adding enzyme)